MLRLGYPEVVLYGGTSQQDSVTGRDLMDPLRRLCGVLYLVTLI